MTRLLATATIMTLAALTSYAPAQEIGAHNTSFDNNVSVLAGSMDVPGAAWAVVLDGRVTFLDGHGAADKANGRLVDPVESIFRIASASKIFTASTVARLVADGKLDVDADLRGTWPWLSARVGGNEPISLRQLLTHTSGLDDRVMGMFCPRVDDVQPLGDYLRANLPRRTTPAGQWTRYSNHAFALAGLAVEESTGLSFAEAVQTLIFKPLGMDSSTFVQPPPDILHARLARAYPGRDGDPIPLDWRNTPPAGAMVTSARDMSIFLQAILARDERLGAPTIDLLTRQHFAANSQIPGMALALCEQVVAGRRALVHAGSSSGYRSLFVVIPEARAGLFLVATGGNSRFGAKVLARFSRELGELAEPASTAGSPESLSPNEIDEYAGSYLMGRAPRATVECFPALFIFNDILTSDETGHLVRWEGGEPVPYGRIAQDLFQEVEGPGRLAFERDSSGNIAALHASDVFFGARFPATYERLPWWRESGLMNEILSWTLGLPILACLGWLIQRIGLSLYSRFRKSTADGGYTGRLFSWVAFGLCAWVATTMIAFGFGFMARLNGLARSAPEQLAYGLPSELAQMLWIPYALAILTIVVFAACLQAWRRREPIADRLLLSATSVSALIFLILLIHFRMLPPVV